MEKTEIIEKLKRLEAKLKDRSYVNSDDDIETYRITQDTVSTWINNIEKFTGYKFGLFNKEDMSIILFRANKAWKQLNKEDKQ